MDRRWYVFCLCAAAALLAGGCVDEPEPEQAPVTVQRAESQSASEEGAWPPVEASPVPAVQDRPVITDPAEAKRKLAEMKVEYSEDSFVDQISYGHDYAFTLFLVAGMNVDARDENGATALIAAVSIENVAMVEELLSRGADFTLSEGDEGPTALHYAAVRGNLQLVQLLLEQGAQVNEADGQGFTPLINAADSGNVELVRYLLEQGAEVNAHNNVGICALSGAVKNGSLELAKTLVEHGAGLEVQDNYGRTPIWGAAQLGDAELFEYLLAQGADVRRVIPDGPNLLHVAAQSGQPQIVEALIDKGVDPRMRDGRFQSTPLHFAAGNARLECVKLLVAAGADVNALDGTGDTPLDRIERFLEENRETLEHPVPETAPQEGQQEPMPERVQRIMRMPTLADVQGTIDYLREQGAKRARDLEAS